MAKDYRVSIAVSVPMNFEFNTEAESKEEAFAKAMEAFESGDMTYVDEESAQWDEVEMTAGADDAEVNVDSSGVYIAEVAENGEQTEV